MKFYTFAANYINKRRLNFKQKLKGEKCRTTDQLIIFNWDPKSSKYS